MSRDTVGVLATHNGAPVLLTYARSEDNGDFLTFTNEIPLGTAKGSGVMLLPVQARLPCRQVGARRRHQQPGRGAAAGAGANRLEERSRGGGVGERVDQLQLRAVAAAYPVLGLVPAVGLGG